MSSHQVVPLQRLRKKLPINSMTIGEYKNTILPDKYKEYFKSLTRPEEGVSKMMIKFQKDDHIPGGAWPEHYGMMTLTDFNKVKRRKGRKEIPTEYGTTFIDSDDMNDLIHYELKTTKEIIDDWIKRCHNSWFYIPYTVTSKMERPTVRVGDTICSRCDMTDKEMENIISLMSPVERAIHLKNITYAIASKTILEQPSVEFPYRIRIDGIDDGAVEKIFPTIEEAQDVWDDLCRGANMFCIDSYYKFLHTD